MKIDLLDAGYVSLVESWGSDERVIESARMSTDKGFLGWAAWKCDECGLVLQEKQGHTSAPAVFCPNETRFTRVPRDERLLAYLYNNAHMTPFEMGGLTIEVKAPIFVFREWHRHRTQSYNEMSARYTPLPDENYMPSAENIQERIAAGNTNKQAGGTSQYVPSYGQIRDWLQSLEQAYAHAQVVYARGLHFGIPKELARLPVPVARYSKMRASANLRNWLAFLTLRMDANAQWEIRQYANAVGELVAAKFPRTWSLFNEGKENP